MKGSKAAWIALQRKHGSVIVAVELAEDATPLTRLEQARRRTVVLLGHEHRGVPDEVWSLLDTVVEIPMIGNGASLNVRGSRIVGPLQVGRPVLTLPRSITTHVSMIRRGWRSAAGSDDGSRVLSTHLIQVLEERPVVDKIDV